MTQDELVEKLRELRDNDGDPEVAHVDADEALLEYIGSDVVREIYRAIPKWYA